MTQLVGIVGMGWLDLMALQVSSNLSDSTHGHGGDGLGLEWMILELDPTQMIPNPAGGPGGTAEHMDGMVKEFPLRMFH